MAACGGEAPPEPSPSNSQSQALDDVTEAPENMSLLVLEPGADWHAVANTIDRLDGDVFHVNPPRLIVARVAPGSDEILGQLGVVERFDGAVGRDAIADATIAETRFATVFSDRYYPQELPREVRDALRPASIPSPTIEEGPPQQYDEGFRSFAGPFEDTTEVERSVFVPYAAGKVVVSIWLPESNGTTEPSTEDWTETMILQTYEKIQTALEAVKRHGPAGDLEFVLHFESSPANGGLEGTIDCNWEFGKQAQFDTQGQKNIVVAEMMSRLLDRDVTTGTLWEANRDYLNDLRDRYDADGAFYVMVAANGNGTAGLRAHASFFGPSTTLPSTNGWNVFMHEFGHIFGARDEYCQDICLSPTGKAGYLGMVNANATSREGQGGGINNGKGEDQPSLMMYNVVNEVNGYTRGAWGWLDTDGDGLFDVVDTYPDTAVTPAVERDGVVRLVGQATDVPMTRWGGIEFSINRIRALQYRFADVENSPWFEIRLPESTRGREAVDVVVGQLPEGSHTLEVRAVNSVGNVELKPQVLDIDVRDEVANAAPHVSLFADETIGSTRSEFVLTAAALDLDGDDVEVRFDTNGDGSYDTPLSNDLSTTVRFDKAGIYTVGVEAVDSRGARTSAELELLVARDNTAPRADFVAASPIFGGASVPSTFQASNVVDREGGPLEFNWIAEVETMNETRRFETGFAAGNTSFDTVFETPRGLLTDSIDLTGGNEDLANAEILDIERIGDNVLALGLGIDGVAFVDISDRAKPTLMSRLTLDSVARALKVRNDRLYVLGKTLSLVDISDLAVPHEIRQWWWTTNIRRSYNTRPSPIDETFGLWHGLDTSWEEPIADVAVRFTIDHPDHSELRVELHPSKRLRAEPIVLIEAGSSKSTNLRTYTFRNTPASPGHAGRFDALIGKFATDSWSIRVVDTVQNKIVGSMVKSEIRVDTRHRAVEVLPGARDIAGTIGNDYIAVAGEGIQVVGPDADWGPWGEIFVKSFKTITGTGYLGSAIAGRNLVVLSPTSDPEPGPEELAFGGKAPGASPETRGLYALNFHEPKNPRLLRIEPDFEAIRLVGVGGRMYLYRSPFVIPLPGPGPDPVPLPVPLPLPEFGGGPVGRPKDTTIVADPRAFVRGQDFELGQFDGAVSQWAFGDESELWTTGPSGRLQRIDVSDPSNPQVTQEFSNPYVSQMLYLGNGDILFPAAGRSTIANLDKTTSTISRVFRVTLETRDAEGAIGRTTRAVHLVPYNNTPFVDGVEIVRGSTDRDQWELRVTTSDPDGIPSWDPHRDLRVDFDNDGQYDTGWLPAAGRDGAYVYTEFPEPGQYTLRFQVRDGFWATSTAEYTVEVKPWEPVDCTADEQCAPGEFCHFEDDASCGGVGICEQPYRPCPEDYAPVCGCDGRTYGNSCLAASSGTSVDYEGECEAIACGGRGTEPCPGDQYCSFPPEAQCGRFDAGGSCAPRPMFCPLYGFPVCGCDGLTYGNPCLAASAGVSVERDGPCEEEPVEDCRTTGCREGDSCELCFGGYECMPEGAVCLR